MDQTVLSIQLEDNSVLTAKQIQELQKRNAQLEEENLILKKASAIFMQNLNKTPRCLSVTL